MHATTYASENKNLETYKIQNQEQYQTSSNYQGKKNARYHSRIRDQGSQTQKTKEC